MQPSAEAGQGVFVGSSSDARMLLAQAVNAGAKLVVYQYCFSVLILTFKRSSAVKLIAPGQNRLLVGLPYTLFTLFAGWWGIPWGPIYTIESVWRNLHGGIDVTSVVLGLEGDRYRLGEPIPQGQWFQKR